MVVPLLVLMARQLGILARTHPAAMSSQPQRPLKATADLYDKCCTTLQQVCGWGRGSGSRVR